MPEDRVYYSKNLILRLEKVLRSEYSEPSALLRRKPDGIVAGKFNSDLLGDRRVKASAGQVIAAVSGANLPSERFWFAFKAGFDVWMDGRHFLEQISLSVFQTIATGHVARAFRAEWAPSHDHAQPHWHFAMEADDFQAALGTDSQSYQQDVGVDFREATTPICHMDFTGFHFAMSAPWHRNVPSCHCQVFRSDDEVVDWLRNLSRYIVEQLAYISKKLNLADAEVLDFSP